ncbi:MAG: hypothetical protein ACE5H9_10485 [Anaerolineae bacterium]
MPAVNNLQEQIHQLREHLTVAVGEIELLARELDNENHCERLRRASRRLIMSRAVIDSIIVE